MHALADKKLLLQPFNQNSTKMQQNWEYTFHSLAHCNWQQQPVSLFRLAKKGIFVPWAGYPTLDTLTGILLYYSILLYSVLYKWEAEPNSAENMGLDSSGGVPSKCMGTGLGRHVQLESNHFRDMHTKKKRKLFDHCVYS